MIAFKVNTKKINQLKDEINENIADINEKAAELKELARQISAAAYEYDCAARKQAPYIVKRVIRHVAAGLSIENAIHLTAQEFKTSIARVEIIMDEQKRYTTALNLYARKFCIVTLKKSGYSIKDIAAILRISEPHAYRLAKSNCLFSCG